MKLFIRAAFIITLFSFANCHAQKMMKTIGDARQIEINKDQFIGKELRLLIAVIKPKIKSALGDPEESSDSRLNHITFYFVDKQEYYSRDRKGEKPTRISVTLQRPNSKQYPKLVTTEAWTDKETAIYGDMIIVRISVSGEN